MLSSLNEFLKEFESLGVAEIPANNINHKDFAHLGVNLAYKTDDTNRYVKEALMTDGNQLVGSGWEILTASCNNISTFENGYKAVAFINRETKVVHIASAGTKADINDLWDDALITFHYTPNKIVTLKKFVDEIIEKIGGIEKATEYVFDTSGHSLGAIVSDLTGVELHSRNLNFNKSVTFDSPGSEDVIKYAIKQDLFTGKVITPIEELAKHSEVYNAKPNIINTTNKHLGGVNLVLPKVNNTPKQADSNIEGWGTYLYNMFGSIARKAIDYLGVSKMMEGIDNHKLKNFSDLEGAVVLPIADWKEQILENNGYTQNLKDISSSGGKDVFLLEDTDRVVVEDEYTSMVGVNMYHWGYNSLQNCAKEIEPIGDITNLNLIMV